MKGINVMKMKKIAIGIATMSAITSMNIVRVDAETIQKQTFTGVGVNAELLSYMHNIVNKSETSNSEKENVTEQVKDDIEPIILYTNCSVRLRSQSNTESEILDVLSINTEVHSFGTADGWDYVEVNGIKGYIYSELLSSSITDIPPSQNNRWGIVLNEDEKNTLAKIVWVEARGESLEGQKAVIEVIFNRMTDNSYPDSLWGVVSQPTHFSSFPLIGSAHPESTQYQAIEEVLNGNSNILSMNAVYFSTSPRNGNIEAHIGGHYFCGK